MNTPVHDKLTEQDRVFLDRLRLAIGVLLELGEDPDIVPDTLQAELFLYRDRVERALLLPG